MAVFKYAALASVASTISTMGTISTISTISTIGLVTLQVLVHLPAAQGGSYLLSDDRVRDLDMTPVLGRGYGIMTNAFVSTCLQIKASSTPVYNYDYSFADFTETDDEEYNKELEATLTDTFGYKWLRDEFNLQERASQSEKRHYVVSTMRVERYYSSVQEAESPLTPDALAVINARDYVGFFKSCGPNYVKGIRRAQELSAVFIYTAPSTQLAREFASQLKSATSVGKSKTDKAKYLVINNSLEIKVLGFGLGLTKAKGSLVASTLEEYEAMVKYAFKAMTQNEDPGKNAGMVYAIEVSPWVDNLSFQIASKVFSDDIPLPISRSMIPRSYKNSDVTNFHDFDNSNRDNYSCKEATHVIDMYGYCCGLENLYNTGTGTYNQLIADAYQTICRPRRSLEKTTVKMNMSTNGEFVARLDAAVRDRLNLISTVKKCITNVRKIGATNDYNVLKPNKSVKYDHAPTEEFTVVQLKKALDPYGNYELLNHFNNELDEYMDMFYLPCVAALFGSDVSDDGEATYFMAYPWYTHEACSKLDCLTPGKRWDRKNGDCVKGMLAGTESEPYDTDDSMCSYDVDGGYAVEKCRFLTTDLNTFHSNATTCWENVLPDNGGIHYIMAHFCLPTVTERTVTGQTLTDLSTALSTHCVSPY